MLAIKPQRVCKRDIRVQFERDHCRAVDDRDGTPMSSSAFSIARRFSPLPSRMMMYLPFRPWIPTWSAIVIIKQ
eukprot:6063512-Prymnesium_polylepis.1